MPKSRKTAAQLDREIADSLELARQKIGSVTATPYNILALADVARGRREFPNELASWQWRHIQRDIEAGLVEIVGKRRGRQHGDRLRITPFGYESIMDLIASDPHYETSVLPPVGEYTSDVHRGKDASVYRLVR